MSEPDAFLRKEINLSSAKQKLLQKWMRGGFVDTAIPKRPQQEMAPLSFAQQRLWFFNQLAPGEVSYNETSAIRFKGKLNITALVQSLNEIVRRHETLRTTFTIVERQPIQVIAPTLTLNLPIVDLSLLPPDSCEIEARRLVTEKAQQSFDLTKGPLVQLSLLQLGELEYVLHLTVHHIIFDRWSEGVFVRDLATFYKAFSTGKPSPLPALSIQYGDFAAWQRQRLQKDELESQLIYWQQQLDKAPAVLELPTDRPRPVVQTNRGARQSFVLSEPLTKALKAFSQQEKVTLFMTLLAAFKTLLYRYTGQEDILVGTTIADRNREELEGLIGFFVNTLVLRTNLSGTLTFLDILHRVSKVALKAYANHDLPFEQLVEKLRPERNLSHTPLFQVMFQLQNIPTTTLELPDLTLSSLKFDNKTAKFDLSLSFIDTVPELTGCLEYNTDLFNATTITQMLGHLQTLLCSIVDNPQQRLLELPLLTQLQQHQLLVEWNDTKTNYSKDICIHQMFEAQVERTSDAVAVVFDDEQLTYEQLNQRANQLAHQLQKLGVRPEVLVGICIERSLLMVVGVLGILKAGGAYVPLDPDYPQERLAFMLADAQVSVLLTQQQLVAELPKHTAQVLCLNTDWQTIAQQSTHNPLNQPSSEYLAYTIYTSGSTGKPKGVMNTHRGLCNRLLWMQDTYKLTPAESVLHKTPFSFDVSIWEFLWPLIVGAKVVIARPGGHRDNAYLVQLVQEERISTLHFVPSMLRFFIEEPKVESCTCLKRIFCSGEALPVDLQQRYFKILTANLYNLYGPTEAAIDVSACTCEHQNPQRTVPIGRPIANTQLYVLDQYLQPVPVGIVGELHIGGVGLARGYWNQPDLSAEKFIPNPFCNQLGERLYKTGDLVRYLPNGNLEFLRRIDRQLKIRGFRIELEEIEAVLVQHPEVRQAIILAQENRPGNKCLVAYVAIYSMETLTVSELRSFLKKRLPEYMLPSAYVLLDTLPLMPNGKVNRFALPAPDQTQLEPQVAYEAPRTDLEQTILKIWQQVLDVEKIGIHDNFFEIGGHSLLLAEVYNKLRKILKQNFSLVVMFQYPTIDLLAKYLCHEQSEQPDFQQSYEQSQIRIRSIKRRKELIQEYRADEKIILDSP